MVNLKCTQCGAALNWDGTNQIVRCVYCGAEYLMHPRNEKMKSGAADPFIGRGEVQPIQIVPGADCAGMHPCKSYVPAGWKAQAIQASTEFYGDQSGNPFVVQVTYQSPDGKSIIVFRGANVYTDQKLSRFPLVSNIDIMGSFMRLGQLFNCEQYCDYLVQRDIQPAAVRKIKIDEADQKELQKQQELQNQFRQQGFTNTVSEWKRVTYDVKDQTGKERIVSVETRINEGHKAPTGGLFGMMIPSITHTWETNYELLISAEKDAYDSACQEGKKILETIATLPDFDTIRQTMIQYIQNLANQSAMEMNRQQMASWDRMQNTIRETNEYTSNVMHQMNANTAATHDRVARMQSEAIRGLNTYYTGDTGYGNPGYVEADIRYDHVYQSTRDPNVFVGTEQIWLEPGVDFEELKQVH